MNRTVIMVLGGVFALLVVGLFFTVYGDTILPTSEQVSDAEASTAQLTSNQGVLLGILILLVIGIIGGMAISVYGLMWFLNRQVLVANQQPEQPMELLTMGTEGNTMGNMVAENALPIVVVIGGLMTLAAIAVVVLS